ncbi:MAG: HAD family hydrolase [Acidimicrobiia bacterium]
MQHVIWDWNGTLFNDLGVVVDAVNVTLAELGAAPITAEGYRDHYTRPVRIFYERLLGRIVSDDDWRFLDERFHDAYRERMDGAGLAEGTAEALADVAARGATQSVLSMWWHEELVAAVNPLGVAEHMVLVEGNRTRAGEPKARLLASHLESLRARHDLTPAAVVMIGDTVDDAIACDANAVRCVLVDSGSHHRAELAATGRPVASTLGEAVALSFAVSG